MDDAIKSFIEENKILIEDDSWEEFYEKAQNSLFSDQIGELSFFLESAGVYPLQHLKYIPDFYYHQVDIGAYNIPKDIISIGKEAFYKTNLKSINIPDSVRTIGISAFERCIYLKGITIGKNVSVLGKSAFAYCGGLERISLPDDVNFLGDFVFFRCANLKSVDLGKGIISINKENTFQGCISLKEIFFNGTKKEWERIDKKGNIYPYDNPITIHCSDGDTTQTFYTEY